MWIVPVRVLNNFFTAAYTHSLCTVCINSVCKDDDFLDCPLMYRSLLPLCGVLELLHEPTDRYYMEMTKCTCKKQWVWSIENIMFRRFRPVCTMQQSKQRTDGELSRPNTSPHNRHCDRPFPTADLLMFSRRSTKRLKHTHTHTHLKLQKTGHCVTKQKKHKVDADC